MRDGSRGYYWSARPSRILRRSSANSGSSSVGSRTEFSAKTCSMLAYGGSGLVLLGKLGPLGL
jgi:hypothetical protein